VVFVTAVVSGSGLCKLCRVRFRLLTFGESVGKPDLLASLLAASAAEDFVLRDGTDAAGSNSTPSTEQC